MKFIVKVAMVFFVVTFSALMMVAVSPVILLTLFDETMRFLCPRNYQKGEKR
jgi:hypothetical protein